MQLGYYADESKAVLAKPKEKEDVRKALLARIDHNSLQRFAPLPQQILQSAYVVVNGDNIEKASAEVGGETPTHKFYTLKLNFNQDGADRLFKYSMDRVKSQLLVTQNGIAIAAPRIEHELSQRDLEITQIEDKELVDETVKAINKQ